MELKQQVVSLELARKLKELGFKQDSLFYWFLNSNWTYTIETRDMCDRCSNVSEKLRDNDRQYSAYTVAELGEIVTNEKIKEAMDKINPLDLPEDLKSETIDDSWNNLFDANYWAKTLIYLKENNLI